MKSNMKQVLYPGTEAALGLSYDRPGDNIIVGPRRTNRALVSAQPINHVYFAYIIGLNFLK